MAYGDDTCNVEVEYLGIRYKISTSGSVLSVSVMDIVIMLLILLMEWLKHYNSFLGRLDVYHYKPSRGISISGVF